MNQDQVFVTAVLALNLPRLLGSIVSPEQADEMEPEDGELLMRALDLAEDLLCRFRGRKLNREDAANVTEAANVFTRKAYGKGWGAVIDAYQDLVALDEVYRWVTIVRMAGQEPSKVYGMMAAAAAEVRAKADLNLN